MPTYVVGDIHITDPAAFQSHVPRAMATIARFGGRVIAGGGKIDLLESGPMPERIFIIGISERRCSPTMVPVRRISGGIENPTVSVARRVFLIEGTAISAALPVAGLDAASARR